MHMPSLSQHTSSAMMRACLDHESSELEALHRGWAHHVIAWQLAHQAAVGEAENLLARMDALIARLEAR